MAKKNPLLDFFTGMHGVTLVEESIVAEEITVDYLIHFQNKNRIAVVLIDKAPEGGAPELRRLAQTFSLNGIYCLFLVHYEIMPNVGLSSVPAWLLGLHAMYYGRVYVYRPDVTGSLFGAAHFGWFGDYDRRRVSYHNGADSFLKLSLKNVACTSQHMPGNFLIAQFNDGVWWKDTNHQRQERRRAEEPKREQRRGPYNGFDTWEEYLNHVFKSYGYDPDGRARSSGERRTRPTPTRAEAYAVLGVSTSASKEEIRKAYRELARRWHPDVCKEPNATEMMQQINAAYDYLK